MAFPASAVLPQRLLANARLLPDRLAILPLPPKRKVIIEVGVALGDFSEQLLNVCDPQRFIAIDLFGLHEVSLVWGRPTSEIFGGRSHAEFYRDRFAERMRDGSMQVLEGDSAATLATLDDASTDIVYVDADHSYASVKRELDIIKHKVKDDGYIILNDYIMNDAGHTNEPYGVIHATNEFMLAENWEMVYFALQPHMFCDVVLRKANRAAETEPQHDVVRVIEQNAKLETRNAALEQALAAMRASNSWRVTAPLRTFRQSLMPRQTRSMRQE